MPFKALGIVDGSGTPVQDGNHLLTTLTCLQLSWPTNLIMSADCITESSGAIQRTLRLDNCPQPLIYLILVSRMTNCRISGIRESRPRLWVTPLLVMTSGLTSEWTGRLRMLVTKAATILWTGRPLSGHSHFSSTVTYDGINYNPGQQYIWSANPGCKCQLVHHWEVARLS